ncbi:Hypothetical predicted protein [Mytilus galloprovincialis]|uniref:Basic leucine zipper domain-containing protein n=1 Tax=Mytilus galloprovincialis TaxID=29158 RepID=A0A8B6ESV3_MYTGA|nr:Hypothetical predicted protein [Mytilus galloprovincialis]
MSLCFHTGHSTEVGTMLGNVLDLRGVWLKFSQQKSMTIELVQDPNSISKTKLLEIIFNRIKFSCLWSFWLMFIKDKRRLQQRFVYQQTKQKNKVQQPEELEPEVAQLEPEVEQLEQEPEVAQPEPEVDQLEPEPEVAQLEPEPEVEQLEPEVAQLAPEVAQLEPEPEQLEPEVAQLEPEVAQLEPEQLEPEVAQLEPEVAQLEPEPEVTQLVPEPVVAQLEPEPEVAQLEPETEVAQLEPGPEVADPEPDVEHQPINHQRIQISDYVEVALEDPRRKTAKNFYGMIIGTDPLEIKFTKDTPKKNVKVWPQVEDISVLEPCQIVRHLGVPTLDHRHRYVFMD